MIVQFMQYDIRPEKADAYFEWQQATVPRLLAVPGLVELRAHRPIRLVSYPAAPRTWHQVGMPDERTCPFVHTRFRWGNREVMKLIRLGTHSGAGQ